jgi:hypothetical protein
MKTQVLNWFGQPWDELPPGLHVIAAEQVIGGERETIRQ